MMGELYEGALAGFGDVEIEHADGRRTPLRIGDWLSPRPGDAGLLARCAGPTLDIGSGPGRLTVALAERGLPSLGLDITPQAVELTRAAGGLALCRDVFGRVPGAGRWPTALLADGNIGIGGDPERLLRRIAELLRPGGLVLIESAAPGAVGGTERVRLRCPARSYVGGWFSWGHLPADGVAALARRCGFEPVERWTETGRWFAALAALAA